MEPVTIYYCIKSATAIGQLAIAYKKLQNTQREGLNINVIREDVNIINFKIESITNYLNLIHCDIQSMMHMYFKSAYENLRYSINAHECNFYKYIEQATNRFIDALTIEKNENLILSYLGLSLCQVILGDNSNSKVSLNRVKDVSYQCVKENINDAIPNSDLFGRMLGHSIVNSVPILELIDKENIRCMEFIDKNKSNDEYRYQVEGTQRYVANLEFYKKICSEIKKNGGISNHALSSMKSGDYAPMSRIFEKALVNIRMHDFENFKACVISEFLGII